MENLILPWVQHIPAADKKPAPPTWYVPFPDAQPGARPLATIQFVSPDKPFTQGNWHATILNMFIVQIDGSIWDGEKVKLAVEDILIETLSRLNQTVQDLIQVSHDAATEAATS